MNRDQWLALRRAPPIVEGRHIDPGHVLVKAPEGGLDADSVILCEQGRVLDKKRLLAATWRLDGSDRIGFAAGYTRFPRAALLCLFAGDRFEPWPPSSDRAAAAIGFHSWGGFGAAVAQHGVERGRDGVPQRFADCLEGSAGEETGFGGRGLGLEFPKLVGEFLHAALSGPVPMGRDNDVAFKRTLAGEVPGFEESA